MKGPLGKIEGGRRKGWGVLHGTGGREREDY